MGRVVARAVRPNGNAQQSLCYGAPAQRLVAIDCCTAPQPHGAGGVHSALVCARLLVCRPDGAQSTNLVQPISASRPASLAPLLGHTHKMDRRPTAPAATTTNRRHIDGAHAPRQLPTAPISRSIGAAQLVVVLSSLPLSRRPSPVSLSLSLSFVSCLPPRMALVPLLPLRLFCFIYCRQIGAIVSSSSLSLSCPTRPEPKPPALRPGRSSSPAVDFIGWPSWAKGRRAGWRVLLVDSGGAAPLASWRGARQTLVGASTHLFARPSHEESQRRPRSTSAHAYASAPLQHSAPAPPHSTGNTHTFQLALGAPLAGRSVCLRLPLEPLVALARPQSRSQSLQPAAGGARF